MALGSRAKSQESPLKTWREARGLTQKALAKTIDYSPSHVSKLESNGDEVSKRFAYALRRECPGPDTEKLLRGYGW